MAAATGSSQPRLSDDQDVGNVQVALSRRGSRVTPVLFATRTGPVWRRLQDWRMRTKLIAVLIIPSLAFLMLATVHVVGVSSEAIELRRFAREVGVGQQVTALVHELQTERDRTTGQLAVQAGLPADEREPASLTEGLAPLHTAVDKDVAALRAEGAEVDGGQRWQEEYGAAVRQLEDLSKLRAAIPLAIADEATLNSGYADTVFNHYTGIIGALLQLLATPSPGADRPELAVTVLRQVQLAQAKEWGAQIRAGLYEAASAGRYGAADLAEVGDLRALQLNALAEFRVTATTEQLAAYQLVAEDTLSREATRLEQSAVAAKPALLDPARWWNASQQRQDLLRKVETSVVADAVAAAEAAGSEQLRWALLSGTAILIILLAAALTSIAVGSSVVRSLRILRQQALHVAQAQLPETLERLRSVTHGMPDIDVPPAPVHSRDEIGEVAEAFVAVHRSAVEVALEQAGMRRNVNAMFVNLARRSQVLVERQLELLDDLEREESDPDQLTNLFKLDHLAARMRRNDENLLVLAGTDPNRRWRDPVPLPAVVMAAVAEIEDYTRVRHDAPDAVRVLGHAVADVVHLLAELLENATAFSPPSNLVRVTGREFRGHAAVVEIADEGLGMTAAALHEANQLLSKPAAVDVGAVERMGLFVVSHLAARHGIRVRLDAAERGVTVTVWLPPTLLAPPTAPRTAWPPPLSSSAHSDPPRAMGRVAVPLISTMAPPPPAPASSPPQAASPSTPPTVAFQLARNPASAEPAELAAEATLTAPVPPAPQRPQLPSRSKPAPSLSAEPVSSRVSPSGLPMRVPMAQLPGTPSSPGLGNSPLQVPRPRAEPDPETAGLNLSRFYGGVRRAETEETINTAAAPTASPWEEEKQ